MEKSEFCCAPSQGSQEIPELLKALGLGDNVVSLDIHIESECVVTLTVKQYVMEKEITSLTDWFKKFIAVPVGEIETKKYDLSLKNQEDNTILD